MCIFRSCGVEGSGYGEGAPDSGSINKGEWTEHTVWCEQSDSMGGQENDTRFAPIQFFPLKSLPVL